MRDQLGGPYTPQYDSAGIVLQGIQGGPKLEPHACLSGQFCVCCFPCWDCTICEVFVIVIFIVVFIAKCYCRPIFISYPYINSGHLFFEIFAPFDMCDSPNQTHASIYLFYNVHLHFIADERFQEKKKEKNVQNEKCQKRRTNKFFLNFYAQNIIPMFIAYIYIFFFFAYILFYCLYFFIS